MPIYSYNHNHSWGCFQVVLNVLPMDIGSSLESMYVTPDLSGVENEILGAAAQRRSGAAAWRKDRNSWRSGAVTGVAEGSGAQRRKFLVLRCHTSLPRKMCARPMPQILN